MKKIPENYDVWRGEDGKYITTRFEATDRGARWKVFGAKHDHKYQAVNACIADSREYYYI